MRTARAAKAARAEGSRGKVQAPAGTVRALPDDLTVTIGLLIKKEYEQKIAELVRPLTTSLVICLLQLCRLLPGPCLLGRAAAQKCLGEIRWQESLGSKRRALGQHPWMGMERLVSIQG